MSAPAPKFSIVIPVYNGAETLARAVDSVLAQTHPAHEILIVDDGSTDSTAQIAGRYDAPVRYVHQPNQGVSAARNLGAREAVGDWLAFLDADDHYYPNRLQVHAQMLAEVPDLDLMTADFDYLDLQGQVLGRSLTANPLGRSLLARATGSSLVVDAPTELAQFVAQHFGDTHTLSVRRARFLEAGGYPLGFPVCEDVHLLVRLTVAASRIGVWLEPVAAYVVHAGSATRKDPIRAQRETVRALSDLRIRIAAPSWARRGVAEGLRQARFDWAVALLRTGRRGEAVAAMAPAVWGCPGWTSWRNLAAVVRTALTPNGQPT